MYGCARPIDAPLFTEMRRFALGDAFDEHAMPELDSEAVELQSRLRRSGG